MTESNGAPSSYYFLLKTENIQPLLDVIGQLTEQIAANQRTLGRLTQFVDSKIRFPELELSAEVYEEAKNIEKLQKQHNEAEPKEASGEVKPKDQLEFQREDSVESKSEPMTRIKEEDDDIHDGKDPLRYMLNQKYKLDEMKLTVEEEESIKTEQNARIIHLKQDIIKLRRIQYGNRVKNHHLSKLISQYESLIVETILPPLRQELVDMAEGERAEKAGPLNIRECVDIKFTKLERIYRTYSTNIEYLMKLIRVFELLLKQLSGEDRESMKLYQQLLNLSSLRDQLVKMASLREIT